MSVGGTLRPGTFQHALKLCERQLQQLKPGEVWHLLHGLKELAPWWLRPEVLERAGEQTGFQFARPELPESVGSCWIILAQPESRPWPLLRDAMLLPLEWRRNATHSEGLPTKLREMADEIARILEKPDWGLGLGSIAGLGDLDMCGADEHLDFRSGWASLAGGLVVATCAEEAKPNVGVWATGDFHWPHGILPVERLEAKLRLAHEWGATDFFIPGTPELMNQAQQVANHLPAPVPNLRPIKTGTPDPARALREYLDALEVPPDPPRDEYDEVGFCKCADYYLRRRPRDQDSTTSFYWSHLLSTITKRLQKQLGQEWAGWAPQHLVTIVSGSPELVPLTAQAVGVSRCLLLYTPSTDRRKDQTQRMKMVRSFLEARGIQCFVRDFSDDDGMRETFRAAIEDFVSRSPLDQVVFDLTPGTKLMTLTLARTAPSGSWLLYIRNDSLTGRPEPGSERLMMWRA
jgi:hypothetical protein